MTQQFTAPSGETILVVQVPKELGGVNLYKVMNYYLQIHLRGSEEMAFWKQLNMSLPEGNWQSIGLLDKLTEEECEQLAEENEAISRWEDVRDVFYINHMAKDELDIQNFFCKPKESLKSRIRSLGFDTDNYRHFLLRKV